MCSPSYEALLIHFSLVSASLGFLAAGAMLAFYARNRKNKNKDMMMTPSESTPPEDEFSFSPAGEETVMPPASRRLPTLISGSWTPGASLHLGAVNNRLTRSELAQTLSVNEIKAHPNGSSNVPKSVRDLEIGVQGAVDVEKML